MKIKCRAKVHPDCYDGRRESPEERMREDGTWDGDTVVCDACYIVLGTPLYEELPAAIAAARARA